MSARLLLLTALAAAGLLLTGCPGSANGIAQDTVDSHGADTAQEDSMTSETTPDTTGDGWAEWCQQVVDGVRGIQAGAGAMPGHLETENPVKDGSEFDPNEYFTVLDRLSMEDGWTLDFIYHWDGMGGGPELVARQLTSPPCQTKPTEPCVNVPAREKILVEDSPEGWFQLVVFDILAGQFYLYWHAGYYDTEIVPAQEGAVAVIDDAESSFGGRDPETIQVLRDEIAKHDLTPAVEIHDDRINIRIVLFTKWGGFFDDSFDINPEAPHDKLDLGNNTSENIVPYDCGVMF